MEMELPKLNPFRDLLLIGSKSHDPASSRITVPVRIFSTKRVLSHSSIQVVAEEAIAVAR
jgi:hypothetical protein